MRTWRAGGRAHARRSAGTPRTPRALIARNPSAHTPRPRPAPPAPVPPVTYLRHRLASFSSSFSSSPGEGAARSPISGADTALPARRDRCSRGGRVGGHRHLPDASPGSPTASLRPSPRCCFVISCPSCDTRRPLYGNLKGTFTSAAAGPAERNNRGITGRAGTVRKDGPRSWRLRDPVLVCGRGGSPVLEEAEKLQQKNSKTTKRKIKIIEIRRENSLFVSDCGGADVSGSARAGPMRWSLPPRLTPPVGSEAISPSRPVAPPAPDSRLCAELLEGAAPRDVRWPLQRSQQAGSPHGKAKGRCRQFPVVRAAPGSPRIPLPGRSRRGCGAGRRQRRVPPAAVPPAVLKWVLFPALYQPPGFGVRELKPISSTVPPPG
ncbi:uncharacterized protein LOC141728729 [Zonotrichia albicollis]|uniref:uncharacterized protein LOC141728729 n=1 Tax=Zonotrichia albicollis TaxID=44394 RepID=UPI003D80F60D